MSRVVIFTASITIIFFVFFCHNVSAHPAWGIVVDNQGQVFASDLETIWKIDAQGRQSVFRAGMSGRHTHELTVDENDNLYGEDLSYEPETKRFITAIWKMTPAGVFSYVLAPTSNPPKGMSIWKDRNGNTYSWQWNNAANREVFLFKRTAKGTVTTLIGSQQSGGAFRTEVLTSIGGITFGADGALYLTDRVSIQKVTTSGVLTTISRSIAAENPAKQDRQNSNTSLSGIAVDASGNVYAADFGNRRVLKFAPDGNMRTLLRAEDSWSPYGIAFKNGNLYVLEIGNAQQRPRIRKLTSDGKISVLATVGENTDPSARETLFSGNTQAAVASKKFTPYLLFGLCTGVFFASFFIWRVRKKRVAKLPESRT